MDNDDVEQTGSDYHEYNYCEHCIHYDWQHEECILEREQDFEEDVCEFEVVT